MMARARRCEVRATFSELVSNETGVRQLTPFLGSVYNPGLREGPEESPERQAAKSVRSQWRQEVLVCHAKYLVR